MYKEKVEELYTKLGKKGVMIVATSANNRVTTRSLSVIFYERKLYFQTDINFLTINQLKENANIALCANNIQIEGTGIIIGPTLQNPILAELYHKKHNNSFNNYSHLATTQMVEVTIKKVSTWEYRGKNPYQCWYDMVEETYREKQYIEVN